MKKDTLLTIILATAGGLIFAIGMCMCLVPEWDLFKLGIVASIIGVIVLLGIIPVYRLNHPKKVHAEVNWEIVLVWCIGIIGALVMGFGMSKVMIDDPEKTDLLIGIGVGIVGLTVCILNYPIYSYLKGMRNNKGIGDF